MMHFLRRFQEQLVKLLLYSAALASVAIDRIGMGGDGLELIAVETHLSPQQVLVRFTTIMIAGSLSMIAMGYSARA
jgi:hypothetical protein